MSRWAIDPPDEETRRVQCISPGCHEDVDVPERELFCSDCRCKHLLQEQRIREQLAREDAVMGRYPEKFGVAHVRRRP